MTNFEIFYKKITDYCVTKLGFENEYTVNLFKTLDSFDEKVIRFFDVVTYDTLDMIIQCYLKAIDGEVKEQCLE